MRHPGLRLTGIPAAWLAFLCLTLAAATSLRAAEPQAQEPSVLGFSLPPELGFVIESHPPANPTAPTVVYIQDAHSNYDAQRHLAGILDRLVAAHQIRLILVEGGEGDVGLAYLRRYGPPENRKEVAEKYLKSGMISGEEYLDITSEHPLMLWGVESLPLYEQNLAAFLEAEDLRRTLEPALAAAREAVDRLKPSVLTDALADLEQKRVRFEQRRLTLAEYVAFLERAAAKQRVETDGYPELARFAQLRRLEDAVQLGEIPAEQRALIERLQARAPKSDVQRLSEMTGEMRSGAVTPKAFYGLLKELAARHAVRLGPYPNLAKYIDYVLLRGELDTPGLSRELDRLANALMMSMTTSEAANDLLKVDAELMLIERLAELQLSPEDYRRLQALATDGMFARWARVVNAAESTAGLPATDFSRLSLVDAGLPTLRRFYDVSTRRDAALVDNAVEKLKATQARVAVLITGGFHAPAITDSLKSRGMGVLVLAPNVGQHAEDDVYRAVVKYKSGRHASTATPRALE